MIVDHQLVRPLELGVRKLRPDVAADVQRRHILEPHQVRLLPRLCSGKDRGCGARLALRRLRLIEYALTFSLFQKNVGGVFRSEPDSGLLELRVRREVEDLLRPLVLRSTARSAELRQPCSVSSPIRFPMRFTQSNGNSSSTASNARQSKAGQGKARQGRARQGKARQCTARQGKARQGKAQART